jgi:hypothetical protein
VVLPEPAVPDAAERGAVQAVLQPNAFAEEGSETACIYSR